MTNSIRKSGVTKRDFMKLALGASAAMSVPGLIAAPAIAQGRKKVRVGHGIAVIDPSVAPWDSAGATGNFWQDEGLDVEVTGFQGSALAYQALAHGDVDIVYGGTPDLMRLKEEGAPVKVVASVYDWNHNFPAVLESSPIKSIEDFRGKKIGLQSVTGSPIVFLDVLLKAHGMTRKDIAAAISVGTGAPAIQALQSGQVDVLEEWEGQYVLMESEFGVKLRKFNKDPILTKNSFVQGASTRDDLIKNDPKMLTGFLRGVAKGIIFSDANPAAAAKGHYEQFPRSLATNVSRDEAIKKAAGTIAQNVGISIGSARERRWGIVTGEQVDSTRDVFREADILKKSLPWQDFYDPQFLKEANNFDMDAVIKKAKSMT